MQNNKVIKKPVVAAKSPRGAGRKPANSTPAKNKKAEPAKRGRKKKQQPESEEDEEKDSEENNAGSSSEDEPLVKKSKSPQPPTVSNYLFYSAVKCSPTSSVKGGRMNTQYYLNVA